MIERGVPVTFRLGPGSNDWSSTLNTPRRRVVTVKGGPPAGAPACAA
jgi:hypothetical protein